jgi:lipoate---protein ligase
MAAAFRVIDTGVREGRLQIAFDQAMIDSHRKGEVPDTVRFLRFETSALVGRHQAIGRELMLDYCRANGVRLVRRITGGGAIYLDPSQLGWELLISRKRLPMATLEAYTKAICEAVAYGLSKAFGIDARYRPRNDIEVGGQKLCGTGGFFDGDTLFYQGTVLVDGDPERIMACLNVPEAKVKKRCLDKAGQRVTTLKSLLGGVTPEMSAVQNAITVGFAEKLGISFIDDAPTAKEEALAAKLYSEEIGTDEFVFSIDDPRGAGIYEAELTGPGGTLTAYVRLEGNSAARRIRELLLTGDFFVTPPRTILDLEASLRGVYVGIVGTAVERFFAKSKPELLTISPSDFRNVIQAAVQMAEP